MFNGANLTLNSEVDQDTRKIPNLSMHHLLVHTNQDIKKEIKQLIIYRLEGLGLMPCLWPGQPGLNCLISFAPVFSCMHC